MALVISQVVSLLEVAHPLMGLVKTGVIPPLMQVNTNTNRHYFESTIYELFYVLSKTLSLLVTRF